MKNRWIAAVLVIATVFGLFGCAGTGTSVSEKIGEKNGFVSAKEGVSLSGEKAEDETLINVAKTDEEGKPLFQIVYDIGAGLRVKEQCEVLAADIYDVTGVDVPVVHSMEKQKPYEITVGAIARKETVEVIDNFSLADTDFAICTVGTRVLIYAETDQALISGMIFFMEQTVTRSASQGMYGLPDDCYVYTTEKIPDVIYGYSLLSGFAELPTFFNMNTESETARELVDGIKEIYDYARTLPPTE